MSPTELVFHRVALVVLGFGVIAAFAAAMNTPRALAAHSLLLSDGFDGPRASLRIDAQDNIVLAVFSADQQSLFELVAPSRAGDPVLLRSPDGATHPLMTTGR